MTVQNAADVGGSAPAGMRAGEPRASRAKRVTDVVRIQSINAEWWLFARPLAILAASFVINIVIFAAIIAAIGDALPPVQRITGGMLLIFVTVGVDHFRTITQLFPFALGIGVTRRAFAAGTALLILAQSALLGLLLTLLELLERATGGWGLQLQFYAPGVESQDNPLLQWLVYVALFLAVSSVFVVMGVVFKRWGQLGVYAVVIAFGVIVAVAVVLVTWLQLWSAVGSFFVDTPPLALLAGYPLLLALVLGAAGFLVIRRATP
jgi:hypothetical protein